MKNLNKKILMFIFLLSFCFMNKNSSVIANELIGISIFFYSGAIALFYYQSEYLKEEQPFLSKKGLCCFGIISLSSIGTICGALGLIGKE
jgi:hypothetical protein